MEPENQPVIPVLPPLYSSRAIRIFSIFFSAIAGGIMTSQNLKDLGQPVAASNALLGSIGYTIVVVVLSQFLPQSTHNTAIAFISSYVGAFGLEYYFSRFITNRDDYPKKGIVKPLLICLSIFTPIIALIFYSLSASQP